MAAISVKELNRELDCPVCMDTLKNPKVLSCSHAFCEECLKQCEKISEVGSGKIRCPKCRNVITLSGEGVAGLKSNPLICRLLEVLEAKKNSSKIMCDACGDSDAPLTTYCRDCLHFICDSCASCHGKMKLLMKDHRTVPLDKIVNGTIKIKWSEEGLWRKAYECEEHRGELRRFYCRTCKRRICRDCIVLDHAKPDHDCTTVQKMFQEIQEKVKDLVKSCSEKDEKICTMLNDVEEKEKDANEKIKGMKKSIKDSKATAVAILNKAEGELLKEVEVFERKLNKKMEAFRDSLQATKGDLEKVQSKAKDVISANDIDDLNRKSFFPEDILRELKELITSEPTMTISKDLVALKCTIVQGPKFPETMLPIAKLSLPHIWRETKLLPNPHKDIVNIFCDGISVYIACKNEIHKKPLSCDVGSSCCLRLHHPNTNIKQVVDMAISVKDKTLSFVAETNRSGMLLYHVYTLKLDDFPALQQSANASPSLYTPSPCPLTTSMARITIDCQSRIVIADNVTSFRSGAQTSASATPESVSDGKRSRTSTSATNGNAVNTSAFSFVGQHGQGSTAKRPVAAVGGEFKFGLKLPQQQYDFTGLTSGSDTAKASTFSFKGSPTMLPTKVETDLSPKASTKQDVKTESTMFVQSNFTMSSTIYRGKPEVISTSSGFSFGYSQGPQSSADNFKIPIDKVRCLAAAKSGQLVFLRWDKKAVIITDQYGRVQHEIKEPWRMYLAISCTESDSLYVLSASWGSHTFSLTKHSLEDGRLLEYVVEDLDVSGNFPADEWPIICNHGDELVMMNTGEVIHVYSAEAWDILDDHQSDGVDEENADGDK